MTGSASDRLAGSFTLRNRPDEVRQMERDILDAVRRVGCGESDCFAVRLALQEAFANAIHHGNKSDPNRRIVLTCDVTPERILFEIQDEGEGFDPDSIPDPTSEENLEIPSGRGLMLIRSFMHEVEIIPPGNRIRMIYRPRPTSGGEQGPSAGTSLV